MSLPISQCLVAKAATSEVFYQDLLERIKVNVKFGAFTLVPCQHEKKCAVPPTKFMEELTLRLLKELDHHEAVKFLSMITSVNMKKDLDRAKTKSNTR